MDSVQLTRLPVGDARRLLQTGVPVYLPVNPVEYHGPHLSLANDALVTEGLVRDLHRRLQRTRRDWPFVCVPDLEVGCGTTPGTGTRLLHFEHVRAAVLEACGALAHLGAQRVVLATFHGDPLHNLAIQAGVDFLRGQGVAAVAPMNALLRRMTALDPGLLDPALARLPDPEDRAAAADGLAFDFHAGFLETSLSLHLAPGSVSTTWRVVPPCPAIKPLAPLMALSHAARLAGQAELAGELRYAAHGLGWLGLRPFPGYTGRPGLARPEVGEVLADLIAGGWAEAVASVLNDGAEPPAPIFTWLGALSLGGRIGYVPHRT